MASRVQNVSGAFEKRGPKSPTNLRHPVCEISLMVFPYPVKYFRNIYSRNLSVCQW